MTHDEVVAEVQRRAKARGVLSHYCKRSVTCTGDRGIPDLVLVGAHKSAFAEVKSEFDRLDPGQVTWMHAIKASGGLHYVIRPGGLDDGSVDALLDTLAYGQPTLFGAA